MTGEELVESIKTRASIPVSQATFSDQKLLTMASEEFISFILPLILGVREEYGIKEKDFTFTGDQSSYRIPSRAYNQILRDVSLVMEDGKVLPDIPRLPLDNFSSLSRGFFLKGSFVHLWGITSASKVRLSFILAPPVLTLLTEASKVSTFTSNTITLASVPAGFVTPIKFDIIQGVDPFDVLDFDRLGTLAGSVITVTDGKTLPTELTANQDYIHLAGKSPFVNVPVVCAPLLAQRTAVKCLEALGALDDLAAAAAVLNKMQQDALPVLAPRVQGESAQIVPSNPLFMMDV